MKSITDSLKPNERKRIINAWVDAISLDGIIVQQPTVAGTKSVTLKWLSEIDAPYNQLPVIPSKVKSILLKSDTGLVANDFFLFNHIVVGYTTESPSLSSIVSGRHRVSALLTVCELCEIDPDTVSLDIIECIFPDEKLLARSIAAYNTNRTMTGVERERVIASSDLDGEQPTMFNAQGHTSNKKSCKTFFKQVSLSTIMEWRDEYLEANNDTQIITVNNQGTLFGYVFDILITDDPDMFKLLKNGEQNAWGIVSEIANHALDNHYLDQPEGNVSRMYAQEWKAVAHKVLSSFSHHVTEAIENDGEENVAF